MNEFRKWLKAESGRQNALADALDVTHSAIAQWQNIPSNRVVAVEKHTGIPRQKLRPDLYRGMIA